MADIDETIYSKPSVGVRMAGIDEMFYRFMGYMIIDHKIFIDLWDT